MSFVLSFSQADAAPGRWKYSLESSTREAVFFCFLCGRPHVIHPSKLNSKGKYCPNFPSEVEPWSCEYCHAMASVLVLDQWGFTPTMTIPHQDYVFQNAIEKKMFTEISPEVSSIAHLHHEVSELYTAVRDNDLQAIGEEMADIILLTQSFAGLMGIDLKASIDAKMEKILLIRDRPNRGKL